VSKGPWNVCSISGFSIALLNRADLPDSLVTFETGGIDPSHYPDCNIFNVNTLAFEAGFADTRDFMRRALPSSVWHAHKYELRDCGGKFLGTLFATHVDSARAGGEIWRNRIKAEQSKRGRSANFWTRSGDGAAQVTHVSSLSSS
jgi:hypothetical protein